MKTARLVLGIAALAATLGGFAACSSYSESVGDGAGDASSDASDGSTATSDATALDASDAAADGGGGDGACPTADMVVVTSINGKRYCIDDTEVTQSAYQKFLLATGGIPSNQPTECSWNPSYVPPALGCPQDTYRPADTPLRPMNCLDWCDARAYCAWAGKRLCGRVGGGSVPSDSLFTAGIDQWFEACSNHGTQSFPYATVYDPTKCNGAIDGGTIANVSAFVQCTGGVDQALHDMVGNVAELEDACDHVDGGPFDQDTCPTRGGGYAEADDTYLRCSNKAGYLFITRNFGSPNVGFRCCADL